MSAVIDVRDPRLAAVDVHAQLGAGEFKRRIGVDDAEIFERIAQTHRHSRRALQVRAAKDEVDVPATAAKIERRRVAHRNAQIGVLATRRAQLLHDVALRRVLR